jgi:hypothetical protein
MIAFSLLLIVGGVVSFVRGGPSKFGITTVFGFLAFLSLYYSLKICRNLLKLLLLEFSEKDDVR